ncbi:hypothetical protein EDC94DRAFT_580640 [Helicostylum pulchrum]|nr:hypothetical protein EDC94DRAFT_580640 [Helicostylum pulchrum]
MVAGEPLFTGRIQVFKVITMASENENITLVSDNETGNHEEAPASSDEEGVSNGFLCAHCALRCNSLETRRQHVFNFHTPLLAIENHGAAMTIESNEVGRFVCPLCGNRLTGYRSLRAHLSRFHSSLPQPRKIENKRSIEQFSFEEGCANVLQSTNEHKKQKCAGLASYHDLLPAKLLIKQQDNLITNNNLALPLFINNSSKKAITDFIAPNCNFEAQFIFDNDFTRTNTTTTTAVNSYTNNNLAVLGSKIQSSRFPKVLSLLGPYIELDKDVDDAMNSDVSCKKNLFPIIPDLFVGSILQGNDFALLITTIEVYARDANVDEHLESNGSTFPSELGSNRRRYNGFISQVVRQSDGGGIISKLQFGTTQFNLLVTGSLVVFPHVSNSTSVGPTCNTFIAGIDVTNCLLFFPKKNVEKFMAEVNNSSITCSKTPNVEHVRQVTTLLDHHSSYLNYRSNLFKDRALHPATIFTLSKYPTRGFSMTINNQSRLLSEFFCDLL